MHRSTKDLQIELIKSQIRFANEQIQDFRVLYKRFDNNGWYRCAEIAGEIGVELVKHRRDLYKELKDLIEDNYEI